MKACPVALVAVVCILLLVANADAQASAERRSLVRGKEWFLKGGEVWVAVVVAEAACCIQQTTHSPPHPDHSLPSGQRLKSSYTLSSRFIAAKKRQVYLGAHKGTTRLGAQKGTISSDGYHCEAITARLSLRGYHCEAITARDCKAAPVVARGYHPHHTHS